MSNDADNVVVEEKKFRVYKHASASAQYVFQAEEVHGQTAAFVNHIYYTDDPVKIVELDGVCKAMEAQAKRGYTRFIYIDPDMVEATAEDLDPNAELRRKIRTEERAKLLAELQLSGHILKDGGTYTPAVNVVAPQVLRGTPALSNSGAKNVVPVVKAGVPAAHEIDRA